MPLRHLCTLFSKMTTAYLEGRGLFLAMHGNHCWNLSVWEEWRNQVVDAHSLSCGAGQRQKLNCISWSWWLYCVNQPSLSIFTRHKARKILKGKNPHFLLSNGSHVPFGLNMFHIFSFRMQKNLSWKLTLFTGPLCSWRKQSHRISMLWTCGFRPWWGFWESARKVVSGGETLAFFLWKLDWK